MHTDSKADEKALAKKLADGSGGKYTEQQIEDQMRIMGGTIGGDQESGAASTLIGQTPTDSGAQWISGGATSDGKPILTQITAQPNPELQSYILANSASAQNGVPNIVYDQTGKKGYTFDVTGPFTQVNGNDVNFMRNTTSDAASMVSTNAGRLGAAAAAGAAIPSPYSPVLTTIAYGSTVVGVGADALAQLVKPNVGQYATSSISNILANDLSDRYPPLAPAINELSNSFSGGQFGQQLQDRLNGYWNSFTNYWGKKQ
ncbi:MAG: hypothetical protein ACTHNZ_12750 [Trinickia sp.]|uniref:hypothetical protein n=1 Tax=Trinickia sp. TaxID=2571163 RepID=UPI003F81A77A